MIIITGAAGFIASGYISWLNHMGISDILLVDDFTATEKQQNLSNKKYINSINRDQFPEWIKNNPIKIDYLFHLGARTDTTEFNMDILEKLNINYSKFIWELCTERDIPLVYASSAATYGMGENGYRDDHQVVDILKPLNPYGESKNIFDKWVLQQKNTPPMWFALKFFNVYGPNEYHKKRMASVILHAFNQIKNNGSVTLFKSHKNNINHGEQLRDFIYVKDIYRIFQYIMTTPPESGIYNVGTGRARTFIDLATCTFKALNKQPNILFTDMPEDIRNKYQYFTQADMNKLIKSGYTTPFTSLEEGVTEYVQQYLEQNSCF